jgi:hypothetical protein
LGDGPPVFPPGCLSCGTLDPTRYISLSPTGLSPSLACLPRSVRLHYIYLLVVLNPITFGDGLGSFLFARRYLGNRHYLPSGVSPLGGPVFFLLLALLRCFSSRGVPSSWLCVHHGMLKYYLKRVSPFGDLRIYVCLRLPGAFRRSLRPSSALSAWASTIRPL